jgi:DNA-binding winged helix-turn-helix (wHTH) protein/quinol monooxygenase YgiN
MSLAPTIATIDRSSAFEDESQVVFVEHLTVTAEDAEKFAEVWAERVAGFGRQPGFVSAQLRPAPAGSGAYVSIVVWRSAQALRESLPLLESPGAVTRFLESDASTEATSVRRFGSVEVDPDAREVRKGGEPVRLTFKEFELLLTLMSSPRRVFTRDELMDRVWGYRAALETGTLSVHMRRLRKKLEDDPTQPRYLQTVWGLGYRFVP